MELIKKREGPKERKRAEIDLCDYPIKTFRVLPPAVNCSRIRIIAR
jgi:hypothetical protein